MIMPNSTLLTLIKKHLSDNAFFSTDKAIGSVLHTNFSVLKKASVSLEFIDFAIVEIGVSLPIIIQVYVEILSGFVRSVF